MPRRPHLNGSKGDPQKGLFLTPKMSLESRNPNHHNFWKKYCNTPPICIAIRLQFVLQCFRYPEPWGRGNTSVLLQFASQYSSRLYRNTPPICIAVRLPFVSQYFGENLGGSPECSPLVACIANEVSGTTRRSPGETPNGGSQMGA